MGGIKIYFTVITVLLPVLLHAQVPDSIDLQPVEIVSDQSSSSTIDTALLNLMPVSPVEQVLEKFSPVFVKRMGGVGTVLVSYRGFNPAQVPVLWNGFASNAGMTGVTDLTLYSLGAQNALSWGNNTLEAQGITDAISMAQGWQPDSFLVKTAISYGSSSNVQGSLGIQKLFPKAGFQFSANAGNAKNDYKITDYTVVPENSYRQIHADYEKVVVSPGWKVLIGENNIISGAHEGYYNDRKIPPSLVSPGNRADQQDAGMRHMIAWKCLQQNLQNDLRLGYFFSLLKFNDLSLTTESDNTTHQLWLKEKFSYTWNHRHSSEAGVDIGWGKTGSNNYDREPTEWQANPFLAHLFIAGSWMEIRGRIKGNFVQKFDPAVSGTVEFSGRIFPGLKYIVEGKRTVRFPTLNDRFWQPGGNPNVGGEHAWVVEGGFLLDKKAGRWDISSHIKGFHIRARDLIFWFPGNKVYWSPQNLLEVNSSGFEFSGQAGWRKGSWQIITGSVYQFTHITNEKGLSVNDLSVGKQLIYMPVHTFKWYGLLGRKGFSFLPDLQYYSRRYITTDNLSYLPGYVLLNAQVGYKHPIKGGHSLEAFFAVSNILNKQYEEIAYRPMPGTQVSGTIVYHFKQPAN